MSQINISTAATLRRRAKSLRDLAVAIEAGETLAAIEDRWLALCSPARVDVLERAADELEVRTRCESAAENEAVRQLADNRRLRKALVDVIELIRITDVPAGHQVRAKEIITRALNNAKPLGEGRQLLALEIFPDQHRADIEASVARLLDAYFAGKTDITDQIPAPAAPVALQPE